MLKLTNIHKSFGDLKVLKGVDLEIKQGEVKAIIGPSGTGKSTLLRCINYLEKPDEGKIMIDQLDLDAKTITKQEIYKLRKSTAMVFQSFNLFKNKTALENIIESLVLIKKIDKRSAIEMGMDILRKVGLEDKRNVYPSKLSGGQQQRISIGRALAVNPKVILFDEPTSSLDPELVGEVLELIKKLAKENMTMVIVTHEMSFAKDVADKILFMDDGKILQEGTPEEILLSPTSPRITKFISRLSS
ncbi:amino acid ABC transporter ATP-binding protein [Alkaliphilus peptidifermentans]|uniref:Amino acid ABC transporter ATP-binding protein, PAAT family (TC 3.A.1.3.-) n=1 Tax=Alkaliphilus peptidifermentans DSM 18978 TaxID=1120976 RepID=A0A1G5IAV4_9FIRM|nr:amino acid ABC transporter ATP-binding protein [Alkaliphilus peptidifermentans]SCY73067.1 amino acid ABC transporter ATP-binding protein, PAAT family (TC 3.A.1.3.-) [Alkaliphilus peptidifermentans DSM 18978]